jgi:murein DD-endopeptidase MepM/ murein hydrolase activator NlpD
MNAKTRYTIIIVLLAATATAFIYRPTALVFFRLKEPYFKYPIKAEYGKLIIRSDALGEGEFGAKRRNGRTHSGIDIMAPIDTPVYASKSGIAFRGNVPNGYGQYIMIYHPDGTQTFYGHLSGWNVASTDMVHQGELIGFVGKTGNARSKSIQPHLHFEIRKRGEPQDPKALLR